ncbi:MAG: PspA/IM30 family protein [Verrucomicrobiales bacterium]
MFKRLSNLIRGFLSLFISGLEKENPEALLEAEKENLREQIAKFNKRARRPRRALRKADGAGEKLEREEEELRAKTAANLKAGNRSLAGQYAVRLQTVRRELETNRSELGEAETTYKELLGARDTSVAAARKKIEDLRRSLDEMKVQSAMAELNEMASGMVNEIGGSGDTLNRIQEMVDEEKQQAAGRARVARDSMDFTDIKAQQAEQEALEELALADFAAAEGMAIEGASGDVGGGNGGGGEKTMGPAQTE